MTTSKLKPFMAYLEVSQHLAMKKFSKNSKVPMSQLIREAIDMRISEGDRYTAGYNKGVQDSIKTLKGNKVAKMRFPSGRTFGDVFAQDINKLVIHEREATAEELVSRIDEAGTGFEDEGDTGLGT
jgi:hypothetical protein